MYTCTTNNNYLHIEGNVLPDHADCFLSAKYLRRKTLSLLQKEELKRSFLNNSELTRDALFKISSRLGIAPVQVKRYFQIESKKPRIVSPETHLKLLQGKGLECVNESVLCK